MNDEPAGTLRAEGLRPAVVQVLRSSDPGTAATDDRERRHRNQTLYTAVIGFVVFGLSAITGPLLSRSLGPAGRGDLAAVLVPSELVGWALLFGLHMAALYHADEYPHRELMMGSWAFALVVGGGFVVVAWWLVPLYLHGHPHETVIWLRAMLIVAVVFVPVTTALHLLRARSSMMAFNVFKSMQLVIESTIIVGLAAVHHLTLTTALWAALISQVLWYLGLLTFTRGWPGTDFRWSTLRAQLSYGSRLVIADLSFLAIVRLDQFVLVGVVSAQRLGEYAVAATAAMVSAAPAVGIGYVLFPRIRRAADAHDSWAALITGMRWTFFSSCLIGLTVGALAPIAVPLLFGAAFRGAIVPLWMMIPGQIAFDVAGAVSQKAMADNKPQAVSRSMAIAGIVTVVGLAVTVQPWGIIGAAAVTSVSEVVYLAYLWRVVKRHHLATGLVPA